MSTDNIAEYMGVRVEPAGTQVEAPLTLLSEKVKTIASGGSNEDGYVLDSRLRSIASAPLTSSGMPGLKSSV